MNKLYDSSWVKFMIMFNDVFGEVVGTVNFDWCLKFLNSLLVCSLIQVENFLPVYYKNMTYPLNVWCPTSQSKMNDSNLQYRHSFALHRININFCFVFREKTLKTYSE